MQIASFNEPCSLWPVVALFEIRGNWIADILIFSVLLPSDLNASGFG
jgi:hypothetical protein